MCAIFSGITFNNHLQILWVLSITLRCIDASPMSMSQSGAYLFGQYFSMHNWLQSHFSHCAGIFTFTFFPSITWKNELIKKLLLDFILCWLREFSDLTVSPVCPSRASPFMPVMCSCWWAANASFRCKSQAFVTSLRTSRLHQSRSA